VSGFGLIILALGLFVTTGATGVARVVVAALLVAWVGFLAWGILRMSRSRALVRSALEAVGYAVLELKYRHLALGPFFSLWDTSRGQAVYRILLRERSTGREATVWARWGQRWPIAPDRLEFRCDDGATASRLNAGL
jgi:hypothetical protein